MSRAAELSASRSDRPITQSDSRLSDTRADLRQSPVACQRHTLRWSELLTVPADVLSEISDERWIFTTLLAADIVGLQRQMVTSTMNNELDETHKEANVE